MQELSTRVVSGAALHTLLPELAQLRIRVFRDYPYLYEGDAASEQEYLEAYVHSNAVMAVLAFEGDRLVGASTGMPLAHEAREVRAPFEAAGIPTHDIFYCGESVLLPTCRGRGLYRRFFAGRERYARELGGMRTICFCGVVRDPDDPRCPVDYVPLDAVWRHFGYQPRPELRCQMRWREVGADRETEQTLMFWDKSL